MEDKTMEKKIYSPSDTNWQETRYKPFLNSGLISRVMHKKGCFTVTLTRWKILNFVR